MQDLCEENYNTLINEIKEEVYGEIVHVHGWIRRLNIVKILVLSNLICRFNTIPIKIPESHFVDINQLFLECIWRSKKTIVKITLKEKNKFEELMLPEFKAYYKLYSH